MTEHSGQTATVPSSVNSCFLTLTSSTAPGGYAAPAEVTSQFPVYKQNLDAAVEVLKGDGFDVRFSWNAEHLAACQRNGYSNRS